MYSNINFGKESDHTLISVWNKDNNWGKAYLVVYGFKGLNGDHTHTVRTRSLVEAKSLAREYTLRITGRGAYVKSVTRIWEGA
jgi:hypothetical protein